MRINIELDEDIVAQAMRVSGARTKREVVERALHEMVARAQGPGISQLLGLGGLDPGYDHKVARGAGPWVRVEEARPAHAAPRKSGRAALAQPVVKRRKAS
ncbi:MAG: type II toxin-antitoxin system VapB family antitoxin [Burkholderiaceae bacterium]|nr:type II toxin-antitoxin system VapB family antitoxin [Burkholderiaceae bacterium]MDO9088820.1 type II toxin-antitoxin system VapB family antitoxin [Burkholderiaceae bacterium]MDP1968866.1 type II toxin-antitoxin system VapB family antitoxin [Burkholderiaceae bacterium]